MQLKLCFLIAVLLPLVFAFPTEYRYEKSKEKSLSRKQQHALTNKAGAETLGLAEPSRPRASKRSKNGSKARSAVGNRRARSDSAQDLLGLGVFGDMRKFFDDLRTNIDAGEAQGLEPQEFSILEKDGEVGPNYEAFTMEANGRPRVQSFFPLSENGPVRHKAQYDPALLWTGLGR